MARREATNEWAADEAAIRRMVADFADAWNRHDPAGLVRDIAEECDHVSVRGRWQQGRAELEQTYRRNHPTVWAAVTYHPEVEAIHFLRPDVAVAIVRGAFRAADGGEDVGRSTWVLSKDDGRWLCRAFHQTYVKDDTPIAPRAS